MPRAPQVGQVELVAGLRRLLPDPPPPLIAHASLRAFGRVSGGVGTLVAALLDAAPRLLMPTFTYQTMLTPGDGPPENGLQYGSEGYFNQVAEEFRCDLPAHRLMGVTAEALRQHPQASRSGHPILSFAGVGLEAALSAQTLADPLAPLRVLAELGGWVLLLGVDHTTNTSIHLGEAQAGRAGFIRWALMPGRVATCPAFPGCSDGFQAVEAALGAAQRQTRLGVAQVRAVALADLLPTVGRMIAADPQALLCPYTHCLRGQAARRRVRAA